MINKFIIGLTICSTIFLIPVTILGSPITLNPDNDAYVVLAAPNTPHDGDSLLVKGDYLNQLARKAWLSFDIDSLNLDSSQNSIDSSSFILTTTSNGGYYSYKTLYFNVYGLIDESLDDWSESSLTWNNAPGNNSSWNSVDLTKTTFLGQFSYYDNSNSVGREFSISGQPLINFLESDTNGLVTLIVTRPTYDEYVSFFASSKTGLPDTSAPRLIAEINSVPVPEPSTILLFGTGLVGLAGTRLSRKKL